MHKHKIRRCTREGGGANAGKAAPHQVLSGNFDADIAPPGLCAGNAPLALLFGRGMPTAHRRA